MKNRLSLWSWDTFLFGVIVAVLTSLPYFYGSFQHRENYTFLGRSVVNSADTYVYLSNIISAREGKIILPNLYTTESKIPFLIKPTYLFLGYISKIFSLDPLLTFHLGRFVSTIAFVMVLTAYVRFLIKNSKKALAVLIVILFSSGLGIFVKRVFPLSIDLWVPEANTFFTLLEAPHFITSQIFLILFISFLTKYVLNPKPEFLFSSSLFASLLIMEHPFMTPLVFLLPLFPIIFLSQKKRIVSKISHLFIFFLLPAAVFLGSYFFYANSQAAKFMYSQNMLSTPSLPSLFTGYGLLLPFALVGIKIAGFKDKKYTPLLLWIFITGFLIYVPFPFQRRLLEGVHIPIAIFAGIGLVSLYWKIHSLRLRYVYIFFISWILFLTSIYNVKTLIRSFQKDTKENYTYYLPKEEMDGMRWLSKNASGQEIILANEFYSNIIPGVTGRFVYQGHRIQTYEPKIKNLKFNQFMESLDDSFRRKFLKENNVAYLYFGKNDPYNVYRLSFEGKPYFSKVWERGGVAILKVEVD